METMQLTLTSAISEQIKAIASHLLESTDKMVMANFLLADGTALDLLINKLMHNPDETLKALSNGASEAPKKKRGRGRPKKGSRPRLSEDEFGKLASKTFAFIKKNPESMRKDIESKVSFPSYAIYKKVIDSLKEQKLIKQKGEKALTSYSAR